MWEEDSSYLDLASLGKCKVSAMNEEEGIGGGV